MVSTVPKTASLDNAQGIIAPKIQSIRDAAYKILETGATVKFSFQTALNGHNRSANLVKGPRTKAILTARRNANIQR